MKHIPIKSDILVGLKFNPFDNQLIFCITTSITNHRHITKNAGTEPCKAMLGAGFPHISRTSTAYIGEDSSIFGAWNVWWIRKKFLDMRLQANPTLKMPTSWSVEPPTLKKNICVPIKWGIMFPLFVGKPKQKYTEILNKNPPPQWKPNV